jgi:hypothetical protein
LATWQLGNGPIDDITVLIENSGVIVATVDGVDEKVDAFSMSRKRPVIIRNSSKESPCRYRFDLAHELGHLLMHDGDIALEMQLKATDSVSYINATLEQYSDVPIIVTSEVADGFDSAMIIDSGLDNAALEAAVTDTLLSEGTNEIANDAVSEGLGELIGESLLPISPLGLIGALFGLPFL